MRSDSTRSADGWLTLSQAAAVLGVHPSTVRRWANQGLLPVLLTAGRHRRFSHENLRRFAEQRANPGNRESRMTVLCVGASHRSAPIDVLERAMASAARFREATRSAVEQGTYSGLIAELAVLNTCNRVELYAASPTPTEAAETIHREVFGPLLKNGSANPAASTYLHRDDEAVRHLCRVSSGLDSLVIGEHQISGQVTRSFRATIRPEPHSTALAEAAAAARRAVLRARSETGIGKRPASVSSVAIDLAGRKAGSLSGKEIVVVGAGKMGGLACKALRKADVARVTVVNRTVSRAESVATRIGAGATDLAGLPELLATADVVLTATSSPGPVLSRQMVEGALRRRTPKGPLIIVDIGVPRDVEAGVGNLASVELFGIDNLRAQIEAHLEARSDQIPLVEDIIGDEVAQFGARVRGEVVRPVIRDLRLRAERIREGEVRHALGDLGDVDTDTRERIEHLSRALVNKLLHEPTARLRRMALSEAGDGHVRLARELFGLDDEPLRPARSTGE